MRQNSKRYGKGRDRIPLLAPRLTGALMKRSTTPGSVSRLQGSQMSHKNRDRFTQLFRSPGIPASLLLRDYDHCGEIGVRTIIIRNQGGNSLCLQSDN